MTKPIPAVSKTSIGKGRGERVDEHPLEWGLSREQELRLTVRVRMPVSSLGYVFSLKNFT